MSSYLSPTPGSYNTSTNPNKFAGNQRSNIYYQGQQLQNQDADQSNQFAGQRQQTADYLNNIENPIAQGNGGYNAAEISQIQMTPQQQEQMVDQAGISAGANTQANKQQADAAVAATGGNPLAQAAYGQRAALQSGNQAGDAETNARVAASNAAAQREENIGQTRLGQQDQALGYYQGQNTQANQDQQNEQNLQQNAYGTETQGTNQAAQTQLSASQTPSTFDKVMGGIGGFLGGLEDGGTAPNAIVGEGGPEKVVDLRGARYMDDGGDGSSSPDATNLPPMTSSVSLPSSATQGTPWWKTIGTNFKGAQLAGGPSGSQGQQPQSATPSSDINSFGAGAGKVAAPILAGLGLEDGGTAPQGANGIFTKPTAVKLQPYEGAVPLGHKQNPKFRPNMAALPPAKVRYGGQHA